MEYLDVFEKAFCKELETMAQKLKSGADMTTGDLDKADKLLHALKDLISTEVMLESKNHNEENMSGYRGRAANGQYISREANNSYADGYSRGYAEGRSQAMNQSNMSGHYYGYPPNKEWY